MALTAKVIDGAGKSRGERDLPEEIFGVPVNVPVMHQVVTAQLAALRSGTASTKTRSQVSGGGQKPWRQKGTGRARHGSSRSPIWTGGGVVFGPKPRDYSVRINKKVRVLALRSALSARAEAGQVWVIDGFDEEKTKAAASALKAAGLRGPVLLVLDPEDDHVARTILAFRNLPKVAITSYRSLTTYDVLRAEAVLFASNALDGLEGGGR